MAKQKHANVDPAVLDVFRKMVGSYPDAEVKGDASPYAALNGHMHAAISKMGVIGLRLPPKEMAPFLEAEQTSLFEPFEGFIQKTYVAIPPRLHDDPARLAALFAQSRDYIAGLKPKKTTR